MINMRGSSGCVEHVSVTRPSPIFLWIDWNVKLVKMFMFYAKYVMSWYQAQSWNGNNISIHINLLQELIFYILKYGVQSTVVTESKFLGKLCVLSECYLMWYVSDVLTNMKTTQQTISHISHNFWHFCTHITSHIFQTHTLSLPLIKY